MRVSDEKIRQVLADFYDQAWAANAGPSWDMLTEGQQREAVEAYRIHILNQVLDKERRV